MRLEEITLDQVRRAIDLYLEIGYRGAAVRATLPRLEGAGRLPVSAALGQLQDESDRAPGGAHCYALRLGNARYPFMKLQLLEVLYRGEYFFSVDTHDQMFDASGDPELAQLMDFNGALKKEIEAAWEGAGLPTTVNLAGCRADFPVEPEARKNVRVLLVEDEPSIQDTIAHMLEVKGYDVDRASDGQEAVDVARADRHAVILMDVEMPRKTGVEACEELKADPARERIPVLLMTACAVRLAQSAPSNGFLVKPFQADTLFRFLESQLRDAVPDTPSPSR